MLSWTVFYTILILSIPLAGMPVLQGSQSVQLHHSQKFYRTLYYCKKGKHLVP